VLQPCLLGRATRIDPIESFWLAAISLKIPSGRVNECNGDVSPINSGHLVPGIAITRFLNESFALGCFPSGSGRMRDVYRKGASTCAKGRLKKWAFPQA
jgi:hypothetical protein